jgi:hypothetical protein
MVKRGDPDALELLGYPTDPVMIVRVLAVSAATTVIVKRSAPGEATGFHHTAGAPAKTGLVRRAEMAVVLHSMRHVMAGTLTVVRTCQRATVLAARSCKAHVAHGPDVPAGACPSTDSNRHPSSGGYSPPSCRPGPIHSRSGHCSRSRIRSGGQLGRPRP